MLDRNTCVLNRGVLAVREWDDAVFNLTLSYVSSYMVAIRYEDTNEIRVVPEKWVRDSIIGITKDTEPCLIIGSNGITVDMPCSLRTFLVK